MSQASPHNITARDVSEALNRLLALEKFKLAHLWLVLAYRVVERERPELFGRNYSKIPPIDRKATKDKVELLKKMRNRVIHPANKAEMTVEEFKRVFVWFNKHFETGWPEMKTP
jgi:hypothetical protein